MLTSSQEYFFVILYNVLQGSYIDELIEAYHDYMDYENAESQLLGEKSSFGNLNISVRLILIGSTSILNDIQFFSYAVSSFRVKYPITCTIQSLMSCLEIL